jgi:hypothetical protein
LQYGGWIFKRAHRTRRVLSSALVIGVTTAAATSSATTALAAPANDDFASAQALPGAATVSLFSATTVGATAQGSEPAHAGIPAAHSLWYTWTAPNGAGPTQVTACNQGVYPPPANVRLAVYTGTSLGSLSLVGQNDDTPSSQSPDCYESNSALVTFTAAPGTIYRLAVDDVGGASGPFGINLHPPATPVYSDPSALVSITGLKVLKKKGRARVTFAGRPDPDADPQLSAALTFTCTVDSKGTSPCRSPFTSKKLSAGQHAVVVTAFQAGAEGDSTERAFKIPKPKVKPKH